MALILYIISFFLFLATVTIAYFNYTYKYWKRKGLGYIKPSFPLGNIKTLLPRGLSIGIISQTFYNEFKRRGQKFGGIYAVAQPILVLVDPQCIKDVLVKDFNHFIDRGIYANERTDPLNVNLFSYDERHWKASRIKLSPTFTSGKMKLTFNLFDECCQNLIEALGDYVTYKKDVDIRDVVSCFTTDVIGSTIFGIECNSFKQPNAEFLIYGRRFFEVNFLHAVRLFFGINTPKLARFLGLRTLRPDVANFFFKAVKETIKFREEKNFTRSDFLQIMMDLAKDPEVEITIIEVVANCLVFFIAGFETSSTTMMYALYELSKNQECQQKLRNEIRMVLEKSHGKLTYENLQEMKYLGQVVDETLRLYPIVPSLTRVCTSDHYKFRDSELVLERGTQVLISTIGLHRDPDYFPDPLRFDPERFNEENKKTIPPFVYMPFGEGPRNCIGLRFGLMQTKIGLVSIINNFNVIPSPKTIDPIELRTDTFLLNPKDKIFLRVEKIS